MHKCTNRWSTFYIKVKSLAYFQKRQPINEEVNLKIKNNLYPWNEKKKAVTQILRLNISLISNKKNKF